MVYCGRPSKGCGECRARKIKCDETQPHCMRCLRANRQCPGYRDQLSLQFRDESQSVVQRAKAAKHAPISQKQRNSLVKTDLKNKTNEDLSPSHSTSDPPDQYYLLPLNPFRVDIKDQASCFFFHTFSWIGDSLISKAGLDNYPGAPLGEKALLAGIISVGQSSLANITGSHSLRLSARSQYVAALGHTNAALRDSVQVKQDTTLTAVLLLSLYEVVTSATPKAIDAWAKHVKGAIALLEMHKVESISGPRPLTGFFALRNAIITGCIHRKMPIPRKLIEMSEQAIDLKSSPIAACAYRMTEIMAELAQLRADIDTGICDHLEAISRARSIDADMCAWVQNLSPSCQFDVYINSEPFSVNQHYKVFPYKGLSYIYSTLMLANAWNNYRVSRIHIGVIILTRLRPLAISTTADPQTTQDIRDECRLLRDRMRQLAADICHSVPYQLGIVERSKERSQSPSIKSSAGGFLLLYPLTIAVSVEGYPSPLCSWVLECFHVIAYAMGINQAVTIRTLLQTVKLDPVTWVDKLN